MTGQTPKSSRRSERQWHIAGIFGCVAIACSAALAYHNSISGPFIFDDVSSVVDNSTIRKLWPLQQVLVPPSQGTTVSGRPFLNLSFALNYAVGGLDVRGYHIVNIVIHILAGMTLFGILRRMLKANLPKRATERPASEDYRVFLVSLTSALVWITHPLQTESVTYIAQRAESLMGLFYLLTLYCFMRGAGFGDPTQVQGRSSASGDGHEIRLLGRKLNFWYATAVGVCALGMATKEVMATAPLVILLFDRTYLSKGFREALRQRWIVYVGLASTWIELAYLVATGGSRGGTAGFGAGLKWTDYGLQQIEVVFQYLRLSFWPKPLVFDYGHNLHVSFPAIQIAAIFLLALAVATGLGLWRRTSMGFWGAWFIIILAPSSSVVPVATEIMAEHRMYLSLAAVVVLTVIFVERFLRDLSWVPFAAIVVALGFTTYRRNNAYRSRLTLWGDTVEKAPANSGAHNNLGTALLESGDVNRSIEQFTEALRLDPTFLGAKSNLGIALLRAGRFKEAIESFRDVLRDHPEFIEGRSNLATALARDGQTAEAIAEFKTILGSRPDDIDARRRLGNAMLDAGRPAEAVPELEQVVKTSPNNVEAQASLGDALLETGHPQDAIAHYAMAVSLMPGFVDARINLGNAQYLTGHPIEAIASYKAALQLQPENLRAIRNLAVALHSVGRLEEAEQEYEIATQVEGKRR